MKFILSFFIITLPGIAIAQTYTTTTQDKNNYGYGGAYVAPVVTKTYTTKSDPYVWDNKKSTFNTNPSYSAPTGNPTQGSSGYLKKPRWQVRIDKLQAENNKRQTATNSSNAAMLAITTAIVGKINELVKNYEDGKYLEAYTCSVKIKDLYREVFTILYAMPATSGTSSIPGLPSTSVTNTQIFYTLLTLNKVGQDDDVVRDYLVNYTSCSHPENKVCYDETMSKKKITPPFVNACSIRECPEKIWALEGLSMEDIFVIDLAFTESAATAGYQDFAKENFKSIMNYYSGKIVLSPYYLDLAAAVIAMDQREYAAKFFEQYKLENANDPDVKMKIKAFLQKIGSFYLLKGDEVQGKAYFDEYLAMGDRNIAERQAFITLLGKRNYTKAKENKLITPYLGKEMDSLLADKQFMAQENTYCLLLVDRSRLYKKLKQYPEARKSMDLTMQKCYPHFSERDYKILRCLTGEADKVMAEEDKHFNKRNAKGALEPITLGVAEESKYYMEMLNEAGLYEKSLSVFEDMKDRKIRKNFDFIYLRLQGEACIAYYNLKDYKNARNCMDDYKGTQLKYKRYWAKLYALDGKIKKAQEIYNEISKYPGIVFDEEDFQFLDQ